MKQLTVNIEGKALDWALAVALGKQYNCHPTVQDEIVWMPTKSIVFGTTNTEINGNNHVPFDYTDPALCLGLIKQYRANIDQVEHAPKVQVTIWYEITDSDGEDFDAVSAIGDTIEQAVARCVCLMHLGEWVDIPKELCSMDVL